MDLGGLTANFSAGNLFAGFAFGVFGWSIMKNGRRTGNAWHILIGIALMVYPYFVNGAFLMWATGIALMGLAYAKRF
jgi:hypothetical protein